MEISLNADAALRVYLPPESWDGEAQHRFVFSTKEGDTEPLLARLVMVQPDVNARRFMHCVVLRPESAEPSRVFVAGSLWYCSGRKEIDSWMTPKVAKRFNWSLFEQSFNDSGYTRDISRFWRGRDDKRNLVLKIDANGWGETFGFEGTAVERELYAQGFILADGHRIPHDQQDLRFLRQKTSTFRRQIRAYLNDPNGQVRAALKWQLLDDSEREAAAFRCENGSWRDLQQVATWVLQARIGLEHPPIDCGVEWDFTAYGETAVSGANFEDDEFLFTWRSALVQVFRPDNVNEAGKNIDERPLCIWSYIGDSDLRFVQVDTLTQHEILEANLKLRDWVDEHFAPDEAALLLKTLSP